MTRDPWTSPANATRAGTFRGPTCGICFWQTRSGSHPSRRCITCVATSMSCAKSAERYWREDSRTIYERNASNCTATLLEFCVRHRTEPVCLTEVDLPSNEFHSSSQSGTLLRYFFPQYAASGAQKSSVHRESSHQRILTSYKE